MKVGIVGKFPPEHDGIAWTYCNLVKNLKCKVITIGSLKSNADYKIDLESFSLKKQLESIIKKEKLDLLHIHYIAPYFGKYTFNLNLLKALEIPIPKVVTLHEVQYPSKEKGLGKIRKGILKQIEKKIVKRANALIVHTPQQKRFIENKYKIKKVTCIYYGTELKKPNKKINNTIIFFGILSPLKGVEYLIRAMKQLPKTKLHIVVAITPTVNKNYKNKLINKIKKLGLEKQIKLVTKDWIKPGEKEKYYRKADIIVMPYTWGPYQSGIVTDGGSFSLPIIVTKVGAVWEVVDLFKIGKIIKPKDPSAIADSVKKIYKNYNKYQKNLAIYRKKASWQQSALAHEKVYRAILGL